MNVTHTHTLFKIRITIHLVLFCEDILYPRFDFCCNLISSSTHFADVKVETAVEFAKAVQDLLEFFPNNRVLVDTLTGQVLLEQDGYSVVFASEGPPLLGCKGHGRNHPKSVKDAQASSSFRFQTYDLSFCHPLFFIIHIKSHIPFHETQSFATVFNFLNSHLPSHTHSSTSANHCALCRVRHFHSRAHSERN